MRHSEGDASYWFFRCSCWRNEIILSMGHACVPKKPQEKIKQSSLIKQLNGKGSRFDFPFVTGVTL